LKHDDVQNAWSIPVGSTCLETLMASEVAISWFAGVIAKIKQLGCINTKNDVMDNFQKGALAETTVNLWKRQIM